MNLQIYTFVTIYTTALHRTYVF